MRLAVIIACALLVACAATDAAPKRKPGAPHASTHEPVEYGHRADVMRFAAEVAGRQGMELAWVEAQLASARLLPRVQKLVMPPPAGTAKDWQAYRARFIEPAGRPAEIARRQGDLRFGDRAAGTRDRVLCAKGTAGAAQQDFCAS